MTRRAIVVAAFLGLLCPLARAQASLDALISLQDDGSAVIAERLQLPAAMTEPLRWRLRTETVTPGGIRRRLFVDLVEVSDAQEKRLSFLRRDRPEYLEVLVPRQPLGGNTVRVTYNVRNAVRFGSDHDELFWPAGDTWATPIDQLTVQLSVPDQAVGQFTARLFSGASALSPKVDGRFASWATTIAPPNFPTMDVALPPGVLSPPNPLLRAGWFLQANPIVLFPLLVLLAMLGLRHWGVRQEEIAVAPRYAPPENLTPIEAGYLVDDSVDPRDVAATLLDLAHRGFIRIEEGKPDEGVPYAGQDFILRLLKPMGHWAGLKSYEDIMLFHTFYGGQWTKLSSLSLRFYSVVPMMARQVRFELMEKGLYSDPRRTAALRTLAVIILAVLFGLAQAAGWFAVAQSGALATVAIAASILMVILFTRKLPHRSKSGARVFAELRGFQEFMDSVEADRMQRLTPDLFESYLPYAVALGVEHHWGAAFSTISAGPPLWWTAEEEQRGLPDFMRRLGLFAQATRNATLRVPRGRPAAPVKLSPPPAAPGQPPIP